MLTASKSMPPKAAPASSAAAAADVDEKKQRKSGAKRKRDMDPNVPKAKFMQVVSDAFDAALKRLARGKIKLPGMAKKVKRSKDPDKPLTPYFAFTTEKRADVRKKHPTMKPKEIVAELGRMWHELSVEEKDAYKANYTKAKKAYDEKRAANGGDGSGGVAAAAHANGTNGVAKTKAKAPVAKGNAAGPPRKRVKIVEPAHKGAAASTSADDESNGSNESVEDDEDYEDEGSEAEEDGSEAEEDNEGDEEEEESVAKPAGAAAVRC